MIYEIRNYHYEPSLMKEYTAWARDDALPFLRSQLDLVGFWVNGVDDAEVNGKALDELGSATVTWIIRWPDRADHDDRMGNIFSSDDWAEIIKTNPDASTTTAIEAKFAEEL